MSRCPKCGYVMHYEASTEVTWIIELLEDNQRREIYEIGGYGGKGTGQYTISYAAGQMMPVFSRQIAEQVAATGIVKECDDCHGRFIQPTNERPHPRPSA